MFFYIETIICKNELLKAYNVIYVIDHNVFTFKSFRYIK